MAKPGVVRRPIEYILPIVVAALIFMLVYLLNRTKQVEDTAVDEPTQSSQIVGTVDEVGRLADEAEDAERAIDRVAENEDLEAATPYDTAADALGGAYNESNL